MQRQPKRSRSEWRQIVDRHKASGLTAVEFARREGLNVHTFAWWRHELRQEAKRSAPLTLVPVPRASACEPLVVRFPDGTELRVPQGHDPDWVGRIVDVLL